MVPYSAIEVVRAREVKNGKGKLGDKNSECSLESDNMLYHRTVLCLCYHAFESNVDG